MGFFSTGVAARSLFFVLCDMLLGNLPWRNLRDDRNAVLREKKKFFAAIDEIGYPTFQITRMVFILGLSR